MPAAFATLDGLRGIGALLVVIGHFELLGKWTSLPSGSVVVDMFFMLSGFVIAFSYEPRFARGMGAGAFMLQRMARLYPLYLLGIVLGGAVYIAAAIDDPHDVLGARVIQFALQLFILPAPEVGGVHSLYPFNGPAWTMFFEFWINFIYILAWPLLKNTRVLIGFVVVGALILVGTAFYYGRLDVGSNWPTVWGGFARVTFSFFAGVLVFRLAGSPTKPSTRRSWWSLATIAVVVTIILLPAPASLRPFLDLALIMLVGPALIWAGQAIEPPRMLVRTFTYLGGISYAIYVLHNPLLRCVQHIIWRLPAVLREEFPAISLALFAVVIVAAALADRFYDAPVRGWINRQLKRRKRPGPVTGIPTLN